MFRPNWKYLVAGLVVVAVVAMAAPQAEAFHRGWGWGGSCYGGACYSGSYYSSCYAPYCGVSYSSCYTPCYSSCNSCATGWSGYYSPYRSVGWRRAGWCNPCGYSSCYTSSCGGCGSCDSCSSCSWDSCGSICNPATGCSGGDCQPSGTVIESSPGNGTPTTAPPKPEAKSTSTEINTRENSGLLTIWVPARAKVFINGMETKTNGSRRRYVSHGLQPGLEYKYVIRAEIVRDGKIAEETKTVKLTAGGTEGVAFGFNVSPLQQFAAQ